MAFAQWRLPRRFATVAHARYLILIFQSFRQRDFNLNNYFAFYLIETFSRNIETSNKPPCRFS
jgi:hypothetical protein